MKAFLKALRYCWPYRYRIALAWLCGFLSAGLWAGSIGTVLPLFNLLFDEAPTAVRYLEQECEEHPGTTERVLEIPEGWDVREDASVETFEVRGTAVRVRPGLAQRDVRVLPPAAVQHDEANALPPHRRQVPPTPRRHVRDDVDLLLVVVDLKGAELGREVLGDA